MSSTAVVQNEMKTENAATTNVLYYLGAIGQPHLNSKLAILTHNIQTIAEQPEIGRIRLVANVYSDLARVEEITRNNQNLEGVFLHFKEGTLAQLWSDNPHHRMIEKLTDDQKSWKVIFTLDDVQFQHLPLEKCFHLMDAKKLDLLSPRVSNATHWNVLTDFSGVPECEGKKIWRGTSTDGTKDFKRVNWCEWFCYIFDPEKFLHLMTKHSDANPSCWGVDLLIGHFGFETGVWAGAHVHHHWHGRAKRIQFLQMNRFLKLHGFSGVQEIRERYPPIISELDSNVPSGGTVPKPIIPR